LKPQKTSIKKTNKNWKKTETKNEQDRNNFLKRYRKFKRKNKTRIKKLLIIKYKKLKKERMKERKNLKN